MSQSKILIVLKHEFLQKVRSKGYIILTLLAPLLLASTALIPLFIATLSSDEKKNICVIDETGVIAAKLIESNKDSVKDSFSKNFQKDIIFSSMEGQGSTEALTDSAKKLIATKKIEGVFVIPKDIITNNKAKSSLKLRNTSDFSVQRVISKRYEDILIQLRLQEKGIDSKIVSEASDNVDIDVVKVTVSEEAKDDGFSFIAGYMSGMLLYVTLLIYGSLIMQSVIEEKSSRIIEILVSSVSPRDLLMGKILGIGLAAMLQVAVWALMMGIVSFGALPMMISQMGGLSAFSPMNFVYFIFYFLGGFLIYSTLYATAGATVEQASDAQSIAMPITIIVVMSILALTPVIESPSSTSSIILSLIPFFSPILMTGRIFSETPPLWQIGLSFVLMGATFYFLITFAAKIYRVGILMYGKKYTLKEVLKWVKYS